MKIAIVAMVLLAVAGWGCTPEDEAEPSNDLPGVANTSAPQVEPTLAPPPLPSNQKQIGNLLLTVNGFAPYVDDLFPADPGTHYIAVDITAVNTGNGTYGLNTLNFRLKDSDGFANDNATTQGPEPQISHHDMVPLQEVRGYIVFKLGDGREPVELQYSSFTGTPGTIPLGP